VLNAGAKATGLHDRSDRSRGPAAATDHLAHVIGGHAKREDHTPGVLGLLHPDGVGVVDELSRDELEEVSHARQDASMPALVLAFSAENVSQMPTLVIRTRTVFEGWAPTRSQYSARSWSI